MGDSWVVLLFFFFTIIMIIIVKVSAKSGGNNPFYVNFCIYIFIFFILLINAKCRKCHHVYQD